MWSRIAIVSHTLRERERYWSPIQCLLLFLSRHSSMGVEWTSTGTFLDFRRTEVSDFPVHYHICYFSSVVFFLGGWQMAFVHASYSRFRDDPFPLSLLPPTEEKDDVSMDAVSALATSSEHSMSNMHCWPSVMIVKREKKNLICVKSRINTVESSFFDNQLSIDTSRTGDQRRLYLSTDGSAGDESSLMNDWRFSK